MQSVLHYYIYITPYYWIIITDANYHFTVVTIEYTVG